MAATLQCPESWFDSWQPMDDVEEPSAEADDLGTGNAYLSPARMCTRGFFFPGGMRTWLHKSSAFRFSVVSCCWRWWLAASAVQICTLAETRRRAGKLVVFYSEQSRFACIFSSRQSSCCHGAGYAGRISYTFRMFGHPVLKSLPHRIAMNWPREDPGEHSKSLCKRGDAFLKNTKRNLGHI